MSDKKITQLTELETPADTDVLPIVGDTIGAATTKKITVANLRTAIQDTPSDTVADLDGTGGAGSSTEYARGDHKHADSARHTHDNAVALAAVTGTNTGDEDVTSIKTKLGITTLSGSNTGDQDITGKVDKVEGKGLSTEDYTTEEQSKLAGIAESANNYSLPTASDSVLGGVKVGTRLSITDGVLSADAQASSGGVSALVASNTAPAAIKARADYLCDGTADQTEINTALAAYKSVVLSEGTFNLSGSILVNDGNWLQGQGKNTTVLQVGNGMNASAIAPIGTTNIYFGKIAGLKINGNKANNTSGHGIYAAYFHTWTIQDCHINESADNGVKFYGNSSNFSINNQLMNCRIENTTNQCVFIGDYAPNNQVLSCIIGGTDNFYCMEIANTEAIVRGNHIHSSASNGIHITGHEGLLVGNIMESNGAHGVNLEGNYWTVTGNKFRNNGMTATGSGIKVIGDRNTITGNECVDLQDTKTQIYGIEIVSGADNNMISGNNFIGNVTGEYIDGGTNNIVLQIEPEANVDSFSSQYAFTQFDPYSYLLDDFTKYAHRWAGNGTTSTTNLLDHTTANAAERISARSLNSAVLRGFDSIRLTVNLNGNTFQDYSDSPIFVFDQGGYRGIQLLKFVTNGGSTDQTIEVPLSKFTSNFDATPTTAGTGTALIPANSVFGIKIRTYENGVKKLTIKRIEVYDATQTIKQDFTRPDFLNEENITGRLFKRFGADIMKFTKDNVYNPASRAFFDGLFDKLQHDGFTHVAVSTPLDVWLNKNNFDSPSLVDVTKTDNYITPARTHRMNIIWRLPINKMEGIYGMTKNTTIEIGTASGVIAGDRASYLGQYADWILTYGEQYLKEGDIFQCPEPQNTGITSVMGSAPYMYTDNNRFLEWCRDFITVCNWALGRIGYKGRVAVLIGGFPGNMAWGEGSDAVPGWIDQRTLDAMGCMPLDHYMADGVNTWSTDLGLYEAVHGTKMPVVICEYGTINDSTVANKKKNIVDSFTVFRSKPYVRGLFNYWTVVGGSGGERIYDENNDFVPVGANLEVLNQIHRIK